MERSTVTLLSTIHVTLVGLLLSVNRVSAQGSSPEVCPVLGSNIQTQYSQSSRERLFMNFGAPAQCNGTVTSWRYCSYNRYLEDDEECDDRERYTSIFLVYRQNGTSTYEPVLGSKKSVTLTLNCPRDGGFQCREETLTQSEQFNIQENDIVASCLMDTGSTNPIRIVGFNFLGSSKQVYQYNANNYEQCSDMQLQSIDTQNSAFTEQSSSLGSSTLHLYAETSSPVAQCSGGSNPSPSTASVNSGTYLNTASPITCTDTITSWHYCYYPSAAADSQLTYTATVGVWRLNDATNQYELLTGSDYTLSLVQPTSTPAKIFCKTEVLQSQDYVRVQTGDVIGVSLPALNPLPLVASNANGYSLMTHNALNAPIVLQASTLSETSNMALHLYPTIEFVPLPTTEPPTTTQSPTTTQPLTTELPTTVTDAPSTTQSRTTQTATTSSTTIEKVQTTDNVQPSMTTEVPIATTTQFPQQPEAPTTIEPSMKATTEFVTDSPTPTPTLVTGETPTTQQPLITTEAAAISQSVTNAEATTPVQSMTVTAAQTTIMKEQIITPSPITEKMITTTAMEAVPTTQPQVTRDTTIPPASITQAGTTSEVVTTTTGSQLPPITTAQMGDIPTDTTEQVTTTPSNTQDSTTTGGQGGATSMEEQDDSTTAINLESRSGGGIGVGDLAAIILGVLILIAIILVVAGIIGYKMKVCGGPRKKSSARYNVTSGEVLLQHNTLLRYTTKPRAPMELSGLPGPIHNMVPLYESIEEGHHEGLPYEEPTSMIIINEGSQVYYSPIGAGAAEYSAVLEQVVEGRKLEGEEDPYYTPATKESELYAQLHQQGIKMIRDRDIETIGMLGEGQFGSVRKGIWKDQSGFIIQTAIKTMKPGAGEEDKVKFLQEAAIMAQFKHPNVITLYGVVSTGGIIMIVVELLPKGDLKHYLDTLRPDPGQLLPSFTPRSLLAFCQQIALGMQYLASKGFVHRDLAARNILLSEGGICKIADFGMSRDLAEEDYYVSQGGKVAIKWTAPEALHFRKYSTASDVWSYGCLLYEIWSIGHKPFGAMQNPEVIAKVDSGYRLPPPPGCPQAIYKTMIDCWNPRPLNRPEFRDILLSLLENEETVLSIPSDIGSNSLAAVLGAPLEAGFTMYTQLQTTYYTDDVTFSL